jgi:hypothetical protein
MNPIMMLLQAMQSGGNPMALIQSFIGQNPQMQAAMPFIQGKNPAQMQQTFYNLCRAQGVDPNAFMAQFGLKK